MLKRKECCDPWAPRIREEGLAEVPNLLLSINKYISRKEKQISPTEIWVLFILISLWQQQPYYPIPTKNILAESLAMSTRQIQRALSGLEEKGYISRVSRFENNIRVSNAYDLNGVMDLLDKIAKTKSKIDQAA
ncbi:MAG: helix-turn-helix domain-containing protein [Alphaproteobacteria bacterium]